VAGDEGDLLDGKAGFEEAACALVPEVMKVKVFDLELATLAPERRSHGSSIERKDAIAAFAYARSLLLDDRAGVVARDVELRNALVIPALPARILAIPNEEHLFMRVEVSPFNSADFVLPHRGCDSKADDPSDRNLLAGICFESSDEAIQLMLRRSSVTLVPFSNETKTRQRNSREDNVLDREYQAVNCGRVRENGFDITEVNAESNRTRAFTRPLFSELDEPGAIELRKSQPSQPFLEKGEARGLGSPDWFPHLFEVFAMQVD
jgi:hypothetical protein